MRNPLSVRCLLKTCDLHISSRFPPSCMFYGNVASFIYILLYVSTIFLIGVLRNLRKSTLFPKSKGINNFFKFCYTPSWKWSKHARVWKLAYVTFLEFCTVSRFRDCAIRLWEHCCKGREKTKNWADGISSSLISLLVPKGEPTNCSSASSAK